MFSPSYSAPELVELGKPETLGMLHQNQGGIGNIDAHLDHCGGHQDIDLAIPELHHHLFLLLPLHPTVDQAHPELGEDVFPQMVGHSGGIQEIHFIGFLDEGIYQEGLSPPPDLLLHQLIDLGPRPLVMEPRLHGNPPRWKFIDDRDGQIPVEGKG